MTCKFSLGAQKILGLSLALSRELGHTFIGSEHILLAFLCDKGSRCERILIGAGADFEKTRDLIIRRTGRGERSADCVQEVSENARRIIENAYVTAEKEGEREVSTDTLFSCLIKESRSAAQRILTDQGCRLSEISERIGDSLPTECAESAKVSKKSKKSEERLPTLQKFAQNISSAAKSSEFDPLIGREREIERVMRILMRRTKNNPCLIGDPGVGKTAIVEGLARRIAEGKVPGELCDAQIYSLDLPSMLAGAKYRGDFEERMKNLLDEVAKNPSIILFIDELHTLIGAGNAEGAIDAANIIKPALARAKVKMIGATTLEEYRRHIEKDAAFERRFQSVTVREPTPDESVVILKGLKKKYEAHHRVEITDGAIECAVKLSCAYITDRFLPDKAIDLIDESASRVKINAHASTEASLDGQSVLRLAMGEKLSSQTSVATLLSPQGVACVSERDVADTISEWTGIPIKEYKNDDAQRLINLESALKEKIVGQSDAIERVASAVRRSKTGLRDTSRPLASFLFTGPSGVGKTSLAKALASELYGSEKALIRLDMSEYCEQNSVSRLIGSPPGYIGYDDAGQLSERVRRNPHHIVLFDEIEKAHRDVFDLLLQILDEGELRDAHGRKINFRNTIIVMTSNVGADLSLSGVGKVGFIGGERETLECVLERLRAVFSPEFLSRPDEIVLFRALHSDAILEISKKALSSLRERLLDNKIVFEYSDEVCEAVASACETRSGAREVRRCARRMVEDPLSLFILTKKVESGDSVRAYTCGKEILFVKKARS